MGKPITMFKDLDGNPVTFIPHNIFATVAREGQNTDPRKFLDVISAGGATVTIDVSNPNQNFAIWLAESME